MADDGRRRNVSMDFSVSIPSAAAASMLVDKENTSDDRISIIIPHSRSPSNKILPLGFQHSPRPVSAKRVALALTKKVAAELLGTFLLVFTVLSALITNEAHGGALGVLGVAVAGGTAVVVVVSSIFHVSGGHVNPAVSVAMAVFGHLPPAHLALYAAAQLLGSVAASFVAKALYAGPANLLGPTVATVPSVGASHAFWVEFITTFVVLFVVTALATDPKAVKEMVAVGAGAAVMMSALISGESTGASMNPARTLGTAIATGTYTKIWVYMVAPPLGAIAGCGAYHVLK
ncbi:Aquaporin NIP3-3 [Zea mays]|uniref:Aquaporin NIP5.1 n=2 Tax=Zea mays TaxID=4577 RepID=B6TTD0_MAIZE|nr:aquaporin NIP5.1 [Zea mays]PWZ27139.1 Aquaporin NIP3-3 [Zea mays]|eukprot:NP_001150784.1 aquaporin NIP5.1 [Zea mays]